MYKKLINPGQNPLNTLQPAAATSGCCGSARQECKFTITTAFAQAVKSITIDGVVYAFSANASTIANLKARVKEALKAAGYMDYNKVGIKTRTLGGGSFALDVYMDGAITLVTNANDTTINATKACTKISMCEFKLSVVGTVPALAYDGSTQALANNPYAYTAGNASANNTQAAALDTDITAALTTLGVTFSGVTVTVNDTAQAFDVTIAGVPVGTEIKSGVNSFEQCNCVQDYTA